MYNIKSEEIKALIEYYWKYLLGDKALTNILPYKPFFSYKRGRNLKDMVVHGKFSMPKIAIPRTILSRGAMCCNRCSICNNVVNTFRNINGLNLNLKMHIRVEVEGSYMH